MNTRIQDLSDDEVVRITAVLARRPEYGIAIPSRRWLQRQEAKIKNLPKELLRSNVFKRLATKIVEGIDPNLVDPRAILCETHSALNPYLIRRLFIGLAYEVTVYTDTLRTWPGRAHEPEISAYIGRLDSIAALWTEPQLFHQIYGAAPFDGHHVYVRSACEACCLAAVGASGRALADLRTALLNRMERRRDKPGGKKPRLYRVVEAWIDHLRKHEEVVDRPEECRGLSEAVLTDLRRARPQIDKWKAEQNTRRATYSELQRTKSGDVIKPVVGHRRRTRDGIPVALADKDSAELHRLSAGMQNVDMNPARSIYRPDSLSGFSEVNVAQAVAHKLPPGPRLPVPELHGDSSGRKPGEVPGASNGNKAPGGRYDFEDDEGNEDDERDYEDEEHGRAKVQSWWSNIIAESSLDLPGEQEDGAQLRDCRSVVSMVHPAFRPYGIASSGDIASSAVPPLLNVGQDGNRGSSGGRRGTWPANANANGVVDNSSRKTVASEWTNCSVYTVEPSLASKKGKGKGKGKEGEGEFDASSVNWPAPPSGTGTGLSPGRKERYPPTARDNKGPNRKVFAGQEKKQDASKSKGKTKEKVEASAEQQRANYLKERFKPRYADSEAEADDAGDKGKGKEREKRASTRTRRNSYAPASSSSNRNNDLSIGNPRPATRPTSSVYDGRSISSALSLFDNPHDHGNGNRDSRGNGNRDGNGGRRGGPDRYSVASMSGAPLSTERLAAHQAAEERRRASHQSQSQSQSRDANHRESRSRRPGNTNVPPTAGAASDVTQLGGFQGRM
ncbi:hypothetical protein F4808DRAFT_459879 [Astrocystis sublimbata]|nr:hypothetical protein F4808DRAFT_459879 [Astrocystis sublimbata]